MRKDLLASSNFQRGLWHTRTKDEELWPQHDSRVLIWPLPHNPQTLHQTQQNSSYLVLKSVTLVAQLVKNPPAMQETWFRSWVRKTPWRWERLPQYPGLENSMDCIVHGVAKSRTRLSHFLFYDLEIKINGIVKRVLKTWNQKTWFEFLWLINLDK